jgi:hypothetical protein
MFIFFEGYLPLINLNDHSDLTTNYLYIKQLKEVMNYGLVTFTFCHDFAIYKNYKDHILSIIHRI